MCVRDTATRLIVWQRDGGRDAGRLLEALCNSRSVVVNDGAFGYVFLIRRQVS
jgi:hypothetical protein